MLIPQTRFGKIQEVDFKPNIGLRNPHIQTIYPRYFVPKPKVDYCRERINTPDNDFVDLDWALQDNRKAMVIIFHGLEGSSQSHYVRHLTNHLLSQDYSVVVMHFRGCSGEINKQAIAYHSGAIFDPEFIVPIVKQRFPNIPLFAIGFSLGGNMLMKLMANRHFLPIDAAVCVSAPLDLKSSAQRINLGFSRIYQRHLLKSMKQNMAKKMACIDMSPWIKFDAKKLQTISTFWQFDNAITGPIHGYKNAQDYYKKCSALPDLVYINKPCLIIHAKDDPFMDNNVIPPTTQINRYIAYELSEYGGHVGFMENLGGANNLYLPSRISAFLNELV